MWVVNFCWIFLLDGVKNEGFVIQTCIFMYIVYINPIYIAQAFSHTENKFW